MLASSNTFGIQIAAASLANKPGDAVPPLAKIIDPFKGDTWELRGGIVFRNGAATVSRFGDASTTRVFINLDSVWSDSPHGFSYWNSTKLAWLWDGGQGRNGNFF
jgi:hypothetical protein